MSGLSYLEFKMKLSQSGFRLCLFAQDDKSRRNVDGYKFKSYLAENLFVHFFQGETVMQLNKTGALLHTGFYSFEDVDG